MLICSNCLLFAKFQFIFTTYSLNSNKNNALDLIVFSSGSVDWATDTTIPNVIFASFSARALLFP